MRMWEVSHKLCAQAKNRAELVDLKVLDYGASSTFDWLFVVCRFVVHSE